MMKIKYLLKILIVGGFLLSHTVIYASDLPKWYIDKVKEFLLGGGLSSAIQLECTLYKPILLPCFPASCDTVLKCAMKKQRKSLKARLEDLINTIKENTEQTEHQTEIIEQEVLAYNRLLERVKKESLSLKEASYLVKKIKNSEALGTSIDIIGKGK